MAAKLAPHTADLSDDERALLNEVFNHALRTDDAEVAGFGLMGSEDVEPCRRRDLLAAEGPHHPREGAEEGRRRRLPAPIRTRDHQVLRLKATHRRARIARWQENRPCSRLLPTPRPPARRSRAQSGDLPSWPPPAAGYPAHARPTIRTPAVRGCTGRSASSRAPWPRAARRPGAPVSPK